MPHLAAARPHRIGLLRHFPVEEGFPADWLSNAGLDAWRRRYEDSPVRPVPVDLGGIDWPRCLASDLPRARETAHRVFGAAAELTSWLREAEFAPLPSGGLKLPLQGWRLLLRLAWFVHHPSQRALQADFRRRVEAVAERLTTEETDVLVVSHAGMMMYLARALRRRGYAGPRLGVADYGRVIVYARGG